MRYAYLPLMLLVNRSLATAVTLFGLWIMLVYAPTLQRAPRPTLAEGLALVTGSLALLGLMMPGGGFSFFALILGALWGALVSIQLLRGTPSRIPTS